MPVKSLKPVVDERSRFLILGATPSELAVERRRYYPDPYNVFWDVISAASGFELPLTYPERIEYLLAKGIALWFVLAECEREDDADSTIRGERPNDFAGLFSAYPGISTVLFNGSKAERLYKKYFGLPSADPWSHRLPVQFAWATMPSTSATPVKPMRRFRPGRFERGKLLVHSMIFEPLALVSGAPDNQSHPGSSPEGSAHQGCS